MPPATVTDDPIDYSQPDSKAERPGAPPSVQANLTSSRRQDVHFLGDRAGKVDLRSPAELNNIIDTRADLEQYLVAAFRVFAGQGSDGGVAGHISLRDPGNPSLFWINSLPQNFQIRVNDLVLVSEAGEVLPDGAQSPINGSASAIHSAIHRAQLDLNAACHAHSVYRKAFS